MCSAILVLDLLMLHQGAPRGSGYDQDKTICGEYSVSPKGVAVGNADPMTEVPGERIEGPPAIKVIGIGGAGCEVVRTMICRRKMPGVVYLGIDADSKQTARNGSSGIVPVELFVVGHVSSWDRDTVTKAACDPSFVSRLKQAVADADVVVIVAGMGGATGTGVSPQVAAIARETGALVLPFVTVPRSSEGERRNRAAEEGVRRLSTAVRNIVIVSHDRLVELGDHNDCGMFSWGKAEKYIAEGIIALINSIAVPGEMNIDFSDFRRVMGIPGVAIMCIGERHCGGTDRRPVLDATERALAHPTANMQLKGAKGVLVNFCGNRGVITAEYVDALGFVQHEVNPNLDYAFGIFEPEGVECGCVRVTLILTGIDIRPTGEQRVLTRLARLNWNPSDEAKRTKETNDERHGRGRWLSLNRSEYRSAYAKPTAHNERTESPWQRLP